MPNNESREALLKELAEHASPSLVADAARLSTDAEIRNYIAAAKEQLAYYAEAGVEDMSKAG